MMNEKKFEYHSFHSPSTAPGKISSFEEQRWL